MKAPGILRSIVGSSLVWVTWGSVHATPASATAPAPANGRIVFDAVGLASVNPDGRDTTAITAGNDQFAAWSPDGTKLAFSRGTQGSRDIYV
ncbi:MAG: WD40-like Beta Propeller Repeat, partial [Actinomycetota bacterium]|nr:WD40-like Beta Propeller Repeat [Actinomycetota bacterium]